MLPKLGDVFKGARLKALALAAGAAACLGVFAVSHAESSGAGVLKVRLGGSPTETRIVIDLAARAVGRVTDDGGSDRRMVVFLSGVRADHPLQGQGQGLVRAWIVDQASGGARLRIDLASDVVVRRRFLLPPADGVTSYRYVLDLAAAPSRAGSMQARTGLRGPAQVSPATLVSRPVRAVPLRLKKVVVIDAGHGGRDPGAKGVSAWEKHVTLAAARALKARLERTGRYQVVMTRGDDVYVPLDSRVQIARRVDADLFISLHADAGSSPSLRGASVYTLSEKATPRSAKFVNKDDWFMRANNSGDRGVSAILLDLTQRATKNRSAAFADMLLPQVERHTSLLRRSHRDAGLVVLLAPDVPAVLLEMGFLTNAADEANLRDPARRARMMDSVGDAIDQYFDREIRIAAR